MGSQSRRRCVKKLKLIAFHLKMARVFA